MLLSTNIRHKLIQQTKIVKKITFKVQCRERGVGLERFSEGLGTVSANAVDYKRPPQTDSTN